MWNKVLNNNKIPRVSVLLGLALLLCLPVNVAEAGIVSDVVNGFFYHISLIIGGTVLTIGSGILDAAISNLVVGMGSFFQADSGLGSAVNLGWTLIRDLLNMCFIFALIYIGIKTILNSEESSTRRALGLLIAAALLINFSLFITQAFVDFTNLIAVEIYSQIVYIDPAVPGDALVDTFKSPIANAFLSAVGFSSLFSEGTFDIGDLSWGKALMFSFMLLIFNVSAGIAFGLGAIMIITRFVALLLYMIFSPIMFMGWILPNFQNWADKWRTGFFRYSFFAPAYLFMLYISIHMLQGLVSQLGNTAKYSDIMKDNLTIGYMEILLYFVIMIGMVWASLKIGDKMSITGSKLAMAGAGAAQGIVYRNTAGRALNRVRSGYDALDRTAESDEKGLRAGMKRLGARTLRTIGGGESGRSAVVKARDYGAGGVGWDAAEKLDTARSARATRGNRLDNIKSHLNGSAEKPDPTKIGSLSKDQLIDMMQSGDQKLILNNAHLLKPDQVKAIMESDKLNDGVKSKFAGIQKDTLIAQAGTKKGAEQIYEQYKKDITKLPAEVLVQQEFAKQLKDTNVLAKIANMDGLSPEQRKTIKKNVLDVSNIGSDITDGENERALLTNYFENDRLAKQRFKG